MKFEKITWDGLHKISEPVDFPDLDFVKQRMNERFMAEDDVARYEELKMENGKTAISLKDKGNKIIIQIKTINL